VLKRMFRWATDRKHAPEAYQPGALKATFQRYLGLGWYGIEEDASGVRVWSQDVAEIKITPDVTRVFLSFTSHFHEWTGSPQLVEFAKDGRHDFTLHVTAERTDVMVQCKRNSIISIRAATAKPSQFQHTRDSRAVGICLDDLSVKAGRPSVRVDEPKYAWSQEESNSTFVPHTLQLEITSACNLKCTMCVNHAPSNPKLWSLAGHMDGSLWDKVRPVLPDAEVLFLLGDGEVFTHPKFLSYVEEADGLGVKTVFSTNGHFLGPEVIERLAALRHLFRMTLSIDSPDAEVYQRIRGGQLAPVMQGLRELGRRPALADHICVNAVVMKSTLPSLQQFPRLLAEMGLKNLTLRGLFNYDFQMSEECPDYNDNDLRMLRNIKSDCEAYGIHLSLLPPLPVELVQVSADTLHADLRRESPLTQVELPGPMSKQCFDPWERAVITRDGCVYPCEVFGLASGALGNLKSQSFEQVWGVSRSGIFVAIYCTAASLAARIVSGVRRERIRWCTTPHASSTINAGPLGMMRLSFAWRIQVHSHGPARPNFIWPHRGGEIEPIRFTTIQGGCHRTECARLWKTKWHRQRRRHSGSGFLTSKPKLPSDFSWYSMGGSGCQIPNSNFPLQPEVEFQELPVTAKSRRSALLQLSAVGVN
jgi:MoaA/NifB/PqqE/SkfB family radical SAM enzyme